MAASEVLLNIVFYTVALITLVGAVMTATSRNIVRSAFSLLAVLFGAAGLYAIMKADFIAAAQVLIYVGGILVLIIFAVMLTHRITDVKLSNESTPGPAALCACLCLLFSLVIVIVTPVDPKNPASPTKWKRGSEEVPAASGPFTLLQYQADGKTGLARGGNAFEDTVVLAVKSSSIPTGALQVEGVAVHESGKTVTGKAPVNDKGEMRFALEKLPEGAWQWGARFVGTEVKDVPAAYDKEKPPDFNVYRGITEPAAMMLAGPYLFAFEVVSVLLLAALIGAAYLARKEVKEL